MTDGTAMLSCLREILLRQSSPAKSYVDLFAYRVFQTDQGRVDRILRVWWTQQHQCGTFFALDTLYRIVWSLDLDHMNCFFVSSQRLISNRAKNTSIYLQLWTLQNRALLPQLRPPIAFEDFCPKTTTSMLMPNIMRLCSHGFLPTILPETLPRISIRNS